MELPIPAGPFDEPGTPGAPALPARDARELVARLSKALQRAVIYPPGHPSVLHAAGPFLEGLRTLLRASPTVLLGVTRDAVFVGADATHARPFASPWLSARLSGQNIASVSFDGSLSEEEAQRLLAWLARADALGPDTEAPPFEGCEITRVDFSAARFREEHQPSVSLSAEELAWQTIARGLVGHAHHREAGLPSSPSELAGWVRAGIELLEGTGIHDVGQRIVTAGAHLTSLPDPVRATIKAKLSEFVSALSPELRGQVLTAAPTDAPEKLALLSNLVDHLPSAQVVDVVKNLEFARGGSTHQFMSLMLKLANLSASDANVADALEARYAQAGGQGRLLGIDAAQTQHVLEQLLRPRPDDVVGVNPEDYQRRLEDLSVTAPPVRPHRFDPSRHVDPREPAAVAAHTGRIALQLLRTDAEPGDTTVYCECLRDQLPLYLAERDFQLLGDIVVQFTALSGSGDAPGAGGAVRGLDFFTEPQTVAAVLDAVFTGATDSSASVMMLARAGGTEFVDALLRALEADDDPQSWRRAAALLPTLDFDVLRASFSRAYKAGPRRARGLLSLLHAASGLPVVVDVALLFLADHDPAVRLEAYQLLFASRLSPARFDTLLRRALEDSESAIVRRALDEAERRDPPAKAQTLAHFLDTPSPERVEFQRRAVAILAAQGTREARGAMIETLARRAKAFDAPARQVSRSLALALAELGSPDAQRAVRAWRWSPAGMLAWAVGDGGRS